MKRAALSPVASRKRSRSRARTTPRPHANTPPTPAATTRPPATLRTLTTGRTTRHAYFNALCALVSPAR